MSVYADPGDPFFHVVHKQPRAGLSPPGLIAVSAGPVAPAAPAAMPGTPWLQLLLGPVIAIASSAAMGVAMGGRDAWLFLLVGLGGTAGTLVPQLISLRKSRKAAREQAEHARQAAAASSVQLANSASAVADAIAAEELFLRRLLPDPEFVVKIATRPGRRLWERSPGDEDFLRIRFGIGDRPAASVTVRGGQPASAPWAPAASSLSPGLYPAGGSSPAPRPRSLAVRERADRSRPRGTWCAWHRRRPAGEPGHPRLGRHAVGRGARAE